MTKAELTALIMSHTDRYKKTNLLKMHIADLEELAVPYLTATAPETPLNAPESSSHTEAPGAENTAPHEPLAHPHAALVAAAYDENAKRVKGSRIDKAEFRETAIEKARAVLTGAESEDEVRKITVAIMDEMLHNKIAYCPINDTERLMLATIPLLSDYHGADSGMDGKGFLAKVKELHGIEISTSRALMVALMKKQFYRIVGIKSGQKRTTIQLMERGIRYLEKAGLLPAA